MTPFFYLHHMFDVSRGSYLARWNYDTTQRGLE